MRYVVKGMAWHLHRSRHNPLSQRGGPSDHRAILVPNRACEAALSRILPRTRTTTCPASHNVNLIVSGYGKQQLGDTLAARSGARIPDLPSGFTEHDQRCSTVDGITPSLQQPLTFHALHQLGHTRLAGTLGLGKQRQPNRALEMQPVQYLVCACAGIVPLEEIPPGEVDLTMRPCDWRCRVGPLRRRCVSRWRRIRIRLRRTRLGPPARRAPRRSA